MRISEDKLRRNDSSWFVGIVVGPSCPLMINPALSEVGVLQNGIRATLRPRTNLVDNPQFSRLAGEKTGA